MFGENFPLFYYKNKIKINTKEGLSPPFSGNCQNGVFSFFFLFFACCSLDEIKTAFILKRISHLFKIESEGYGSN